ncbi:hypothetical protein PCASD_23288, partial [Puccinia coronata f. sp. avenae]
GSRGHGISSRPQLIMHPIKHLNHRSYNNLIGLLPHLLSCSTPVHPNDLSPRTS